LEFSGHGAQAALSAAPAYVSAGQSAQTVFEVGVQACATRLPGWQRLQATHTPPER
jgi:hypothetical protein